MALAGKVALVSGAAGGIGRALVEHLTEADARVVAVDIRAPEGFGPGVLPLALDVTDERSAAEYVARAQRAFGLVTLAVLNAGIDAAFRPDDLAGARRATAGRIPLGRLGTPADIARFVPFLLDDGAAFATGGAYRVDGGALAGLAG